MHGLEQSSYHKILRISAVVMTLVLVFQSGILLPATAGLTLQTQDFVATAVGVSVGVKETELNRYTAALTEREQELAAREAAVADREISVALNAGGGLTNQNTTTYLLSTILFILLVLIILNYVLDYLRLRESQRYDTTPSVT